MPTRGAREVPRENSTGVKPDCQPQDMVDLASTPA